jgi:hypothetical protein
MTVKEKEEKQYTAEIKKMEKFAKMRGFYNARVKYAAACCVESGRKLKFAPTWTNKK